MFHVSSSKLHEKGFTLIELLVVIAIIGVLSSIVLVSLNVAREKARDATRKQDITQLRKVLEMYYSEHGEYPASGGASTPNGGWSNSGDASWDSLETKLSEYGTLPKDPINDAAWGSATYNYCYYSRGYGCDQQWYMLIYKLKNPNIPNPGVTACNGTHFNYGGKINVGMCQKCD